MQDSGSASGGGAVGSGTSGESAVAGNASRFIERLYRSSNSYADRLTAEELGWVDVDLGLHDYVVQLAATGHQIIVTGNPGDGKTHLIERLRVELEKAGAIVFTDANVLSDEEILATWRKCDADAQAMVLAINEWPLFVLRRHALATDFKPLQESLRQVQHAVSYGREALHDPEGRVRVIDLGLRNVLARPIVLSVIDRLTDERFYEGLPATDPATTNRNALRELRVRERIATLLGEVARRGHHATMRQLVGFVAFLITGGRDVDARMAQGVDALYYAQLAFEGGEGPLFDAVREAFDPATVTHPRRDMDLWRATTASAGQVEAEQVPAIDAPPSHERIREYRGLKRRFFFEHPDGDSLIGLLPRDERSFDDLVAKGRVGGATVVRELLVAINRFYEPDGSDEDREQLVLWQSHRFDVRAPITFLALHRIHHDRFDVRAPRLAKWVDEWLPDDQRLLRTFALTASDEYGKIVASLLVDRALYLTLVEARRGLGRASWSRNAARRITRFVDELHNSVSSNKDVVDVRIRNVENNIEESFEIQRMSEARYRL